MAALEAEADAFEASARGLSWIPCESVEPLLWFTFAEPSVAFLWSLTAGLRLTSSAGFFGLSVLVGVGVVGGVLVDVVLDGVGVLDDGVDVGVVDDPLGVGVETFVDGVPVVVVVVVFPPPFPPRCVSAFLGVPHGVRVMPLEGVGMGVLPLGAAATPASRCFQ